MNSRKINIYSNLQNLVPSIYLNGKCPGSTLALISALLALSPLATTKFNNNFIDTVILLQVTKHDFEQYTKESELWRSLDKNRYAGISIIQ